MTKRSHLYGGTAMAVTLSLCALQVHAAGAAGGGAAAADASTTIAELIVTAEKREQRLQDVPVAITAFSAEQRSLIGIESIQDLTNFTPGLHYSSINNRPYIRGVGRNTDNLAVASAVAVYYNGIYDGANANTILQHSDLFIDNIEIDRGPQNTLHGANSDGGTINYVSKKPTKDFYAEGRVGFSNYEKEFVEGVVSGPISDNWRVRLGANYTTEDGGFFKNLAGGDRVGGTGPQGNSGQTQYWEAQVDGNIGEHFDAWGMASSGQYYTNYHTTAVQGAIPNNFVLNGGLEPSSFFGLCGISGVAAANPGCATGPGGPAGTSVVSVTPRGGATANQFPGNNPSTLDPRTFIQGGDSTNKQRADIALATKLTYHFPSVDLTYLGGYQKFSYLLDFVTAADAGLKTFSVSGAPTFGGLCALNAAAIGATAASCTSPLAINPSPNQTHFDEFDQFYSHELNLSSTGDGPFSWIVGGYYYHEKYEQPVWAGVEPNQSQLQHPFIPNFVNFTLTAAPINPSSAASTSDTFLTYTSEAAFGQVTYKFNDEWKVTAGARYTEDHKEGQQLWRVVNFDTQAPFQSNAFGAATPAIDITALAVASSLASAFPGASIATINAATGNAQRNLDAKWHAWTGDADVDWTPDHDTLVYARYARGYKAGGFTTFTIGANPETGLETVDSYEIGLKKTIGGVFQINADAFYEDYKNDQIPLTVQDPVSGIVSGKLFNLADVHITGVEIEGTWHPIDPFTLSFQYAHLNAEVRDPGACFEDTVDPLAQQPGASTAGCKQNPATTNATTGVVTQPAVVLQNLKGNKLPDAAPNKVSVNALYSWTLDPGKLTLSGTYIWKDSTYGTLFNRPYSLAPSYDEVDFRITFADNKGRYKIIAFVNNAFDSLGYDGQSGTLLLAGTPSSTIAAAGNETIVRNPSFIAPRTFGIEFQYKFR
jgi:iron complex outermembrane receptor protein